MVEWAEMRIPLTKIRSRRAWGEHSLRASRVGLLVCALSTCVALDAPSAVAGASARDALRHGKQPTIRAKPTSLMVNESTALKGSGFPKNVSVTLRECPSTTWIAPQQPCLEGHSVTVETSRTGRFSTSFRVGVCEGEFSGPTRKTCFIGEPEPTGIDTIELSGAVTIQVSYP